jgi:hypothetical protein
MWIVNVVTVCSSEPAPEALAKEFAIPPLALQARFTAALRACWGPPRQGWGRSLLRLSCAVIASGRVSAKMLKFANAPVMQ